MKRVKYTGNTPEYLDGFPKDCKRSCKGAIHLLPNALRDITIGEYDFIKKQYPKLRLMVVPIEKPSVKMVKAPTASKTQTLRKERVEESEGSASKKKTSKKRKS